jgi:hypothetical protein
VSTQPNVTDVGVLKDRDDSHGLPLVVKSNGVEYIQDGHHRLTQQYLRGDKTAKVRYVDLDKKPSTNVFCSTGEGGGVDPTCGKGNGSAEGGAPKGTPIAAHPSDSSPGKGKADGTGGDTSGSVDPKNKPGERHRLVGKDRTHEGVPLDTAKNMTAEQARDAVKWHDGMVQVGHNAPSANLKDDATRPSLSDGERGALQKYSYHNDGPLNARKRGYGKTDSPYGEEFFKEMDTQLQSAFDKAPVMKKPVTVVRGMPVNNAQHLEGFLAKMNEGLGKGGEVDLPGYTSTAVPGGLAYKMGLGKAEGAIPKPFAGFGTAGRVHMKINAVHGLDMGPHSQLPGESELLLDHRSKYKVKSVTQAKDGTWNVELDQLAPKRG